MVDVAVATPGVAGVVVVGGYSMLDGVASSNAGMAIVTLDPWDDRSSKELQIEAIIGGLQRKLWVMPAAIASPMTLVSESRCSGATISRSGLSLMAVSI